jgi:hypothetical protein
MQAGGPERVVRDEVRAYQYVPLTLHADAGDELLLWLSDRDGLLVLDVQAPSGLRWLTGARPGPDGMVMRLIEAGDYRLAVVMSGDAARTGKAAAFELRLRLRLRRRR